MNVIFYGNFGGSNWGNESALLAMVSRVRALHPDSRMRCICSGPAVVQSRLGIDAVPFATSVDALWRRDVPLPRRLWIAARRLVAEIGQYASAFRTLKGTEMLVVPGTGLMTDVLGLHAWGPYSMFKWVIMAKARRAQVLIVSVGAGPVDSTAGRLLFKAVLSLANYTSYRDEKSLAYMNALGARSKPGAVYPDLVFSLPQATDPPARTSDPGRRKVVGLGLMVYSSDYSGRDDNTYDGYLKALAEFAEWLLDQGHSIQLLLGDDDTEVIADFNSAVRARLGRDSPNIEYQPCESVDDVRAVLAATDLVVATRFHNVLLAMVERKPVLAISFHSKCTELMQQMSLREYCQDIHQIDAAWLIEQFETLERNHDEVQSVMARGVDQARVALKEQYERLFTREQASL